MKRTLAQIVDNADKLAGVQQHHTPTACECGLAIGELSKAFRILLQHRPELANLTEDADAPVVTTHPFSERHKAEARLLRAKGWTAEDAREWWWRQPAAADDDNKWTQDAAIASILWDLGWRREREGSRWTKASQPIPLMQFTTAEVVQLELELTPE